MAGDVNTATRPATRTAVLAIVGDPCHIRGMTAPVTAYTGWTGRILAVDLTRGKTDIMRPNRETYEKFLGGKGLAGHFLRSHVTLPFDHPDMPVLIMAGPLVGTLAPTSGRVCIMSRSPQTGTVGDSSVGGKLGTQLKRAGFDGIVITGKSANPCGIEIEDGEAHIVDASALSGAQTSRVFDALLRPNGRFGSVACVGPGAENGSKLACVAVDRHHAAGRGGLGLSFGVKNLKYVGVSGSGKVAVADKQALLSAREEIVRLTMASPALMGEQGFACFGTGAVFDLMDARRMMPTDNFTKTRFASASKLNAFAYRQKFSPKRYGCKGCHIQCKKVRTGGDGASPDERAMPEFETMSHFTALIGNTDMDLVVAANDLCGELGLDTIATGSTLACLRELDGREFDGPDVLDLIREIASGTSKLSHGSLELARSRGKADASMSVKGLELAAYDPRGAYGMALAYATSTRGGCHLRAYPISHEILRKPVSTDRFSFSGKARMVKIAEDMNAAVDSLTACKFIFFAATLEEYAKAFTAVTGIGLSAQDLLRIGERVYYHERIMNAENGFGAVDDDLPPRFFTEEGSSGGGVTVAPIDRDAFLAARTAYYKVRGLDGNGLPTVEKAGELGLAWEN